MDCALKNKLNYSVHVEDFHAVAWTVILQQKGWGVIFCGRSGCLPQSKPMQVRFIFHMCEHVDNCLSVRCT